MLLKLGMKNNFMSYKVCTKCIFVLFLIFNIALESLSTSFAASFTNTNQFNTKSFHLRISGSSTVYPFVSLAAENFATQTSYKLPIIESVGTGNGFKAFCSPNEGYAPHIVSASRNIKESELMLCNKNNIKDILEIPIGYDAIAIAQGHRNKTKSGIFTYLNTHKWFKKIDTRKQNESIISDIQLTSNQIFLAIAKFVPSKLNNELILNPYKYWSEIDESLPRRKIIVYGPPTTSGTRDSFVELVMLPNCIDNPYFIKTHPDKSLRKKHCERIRSDGHYIDVGENDNVTVRKISLSKDAIGILGYDYLSQNKDKISAITINLQDIVKIQNINNLHHKNEFNFNYPLIRPIFLVSSKEIIKKNKEVHDFLLHILSDTANGEGGYLAKINLIPLEQTKRDEYIKAIKEASQ